MIKTEIGYTTPEKITVRGKDLSRELMGKVDFVEGLVLCTLGRMPSPAEKSILNALLVVGLDHGLTPSAITARLTYLGAPESLQGAVAAGLLGAGSRLLGTTERAIRQFQEFAADVEQDGGADGNIALAHRLVETRLARGDTLYGYGHPIHKQFDPRVPSLREIARANGCYGRHWLLADALATVLMERSKCRRVNILLAAR
jgi:citrate synthase